MTTNPLTQETSHISSQTSSKALNISAKLCIYTALLGQLIFAVYIVAFYYKATLSGELHVWNKVLPQGYVPGDFFGNLFLGSHLMLAAVVTFGGLIQLAPFVRKHYPKLHKWNGRVYIIAASYIALGGFYLIMTRTAHGGIFEFAGLSLNTLLILWFGFMAWSQARAKQFTQHMQWALRLFVVVSGVWFFRVGLMLWLMIHQAPVGFDPETFRGPFLSFLIFACYLIPLALLEVYFYVKQHGRNIHKMFTTAILTIFAISMAAGIFGATMGLWLPRIQ